MRWNINITEYYSQNHQDSTSSFRSAHEGRSREGPILSGTWSTPVFLTHLSSNERTGSVPRSFLQEHGSYSNYFVIKLLFSYSLKPGPQLTRRRALKKNGRNNESKYDVTLSLNTTRPPLSVRHKMTRQRIQTQTAELMRVSGVRSGAALCVMDGWFSSVMFK